MRGVGVACAAFVDGARGHVWFAPNLAWRDVDLGHRIEELVGAPVSAIGVGPGREQTITREV